MQLLLCNSKLPRNWCNPCPVPNKVHPSAKLLSNLERNDYQYLHLIINDAILHGIEEKVTPNFADGGDSWRALPVMLTGFLDS